MSLDDIHLPSIVLQDLFKQSLIYLKDEKGKEENNAEISFNTLGNNARQVLILVENEEAIYLPDDQLNFLLGILSACNLTMNDVAIFNTRKNKPANYKTLGAELKSEKFLLFGVSPAMIELPLDFPYYQVQQFNQQVYLTAPDLHTLQNNKSEKIKLWNSLKQIFTI